MYNRKYGGIWENPDPEMKKNSEKIFKTPLSSGKHFLEIKIPMNERHFPVYQMVDLSFFIGSYLAIIRRAVKISSGEI